MICAISVSGLYRAYMTKIYSRFASPHPVLAAVCLHKIRTSVRDKNTTAQAPKTSLKSENTSLENEIDA